jgi:endogenous inhibitor of DNA gyrase (YacG/DUF329 family)
MTAIVDCPVCGDKSVFSPANRWRPFCSERCKLIDLGQWATDSYAIPADPPDPEQAGEWLPTEPRRN